MYFVDREKIEKTLQFIEGQVEVFQTLNEINDDVKKRALERVAHTLIDSVLTVGNAMIDGFIMRDPGSYEDIIDILLDEKVITEDMAEQFKTFLPYQKQLVHDYIQIEHQQLFNALKNCLEAFIHFPKKVRQYLEQELTGVTAFKK